MSAADRSELRLRPRDRWALLACAALTVVLLVVGVQLYPKVNPEAAIEFNVDRETSKVTAEAFLEKLGYSVDDFKSASRFTFDNNSKVFLEKTLGLDEYNRLTSGDVRMWRWGHRWFQPQQKEEYRVEVSTSGEVVAFEHLIEEAAPGARLEEVEARRMAESFASGQLGLRLGTLSFLEVDTQERPERRDYTFVWTDPAVDVGAGEYRHEIRIQGDRPGAYDQYVHVPEAWERDYKALRSKNSTTAVVAGALWVLTGLAAVIILFRRIGTRDLRWKLALMFGSVATVLAILGQLNRLPLFFFEFDTTQSLTAWALDAGIEILLSAAAIGLVITLLTASGETLYRERYKDKVSLSSLFTPKGLRTRRFLMSTVYGFTLAALFFVFQEVFYLVAGRFGAWAPADIPYTELLGTAMPWAFLLVVGFQPAVTEEFLSRMFSIPLLQKYTRRTWIAVLVPAIIWGFAHAEYPNEPFFIRGLEVGFVGIILGIVMLRVGILAPLVFHFVIDALLSSLLLFRSGQTYYVASAAFACGVLLLPLAYSIVAYLRRGRFEDVEPLLNEAEPGPIPQESKPEPEMLLVAPAAWPSRRRAVVLGLSLVLGLIVLLAPSTSLDRPEARSISSEEARSFADGAVARLGADPAEFSTSIVGRSGGSRRSLEYVDETAGRAGMKDAVERYSADFRWVVRYFKPQEPTEYIVEVDGADGHLLALRRELGEDAAGSNLDSNAARLRAQSFLVARGHELSTLELRDRSTEKLPQRRDHSFTWEAVEGDARNLGDARHRVEIGIQGDEVGAYRTTLRVPEEWERDRKKQGLASVLRRIGLTFVGGLLLGLAIFLLLDGHRRGATAWKRVLLFAIPFVLILVLGRINQWPETLAAYPTSTPWSQYLLFMAALAGMSVAFFGLVQVVCIGAIGTFFPDVWGLRHLSFRRAAVPDALIAGVFGTVMWLTASWITGWMASWASGTFRPPVGEMQVSSLQPWFQIVSSVVGQWILEVAAVAALVRIVQMSRTHKWIRPLLALGLLLMPPVVHGPMAWAVGLGMVVVWSTAFVVFARFIAGRNRLAYALAVFFALSVEELMPFLGSDGLYFQLQGWIAMGVLGLPVLWLIFGALAREPEGIAIEQGAEI